MKILVITGGIGSGKSEVCGILRGLGFTAQYNADSRVKSLYEEHPALLDSIEKALKADLRNPDGNFLPKRLSEIIFADRKAMEAVENLVFPVLMDDFRAFADNHGDDEVIVFESATVLEKPYFDNFADRTILVTAPYSTRLRRACARDGASEEAVKARMDNQKLINSLSEGQNDPRIDAVITNDAGTEELKERTREAISHLFE